MLANYCMPFSRECLQCVCVLVCVCVFVSMCVPVFVCVCMCVCMWTVHVAYKCSMYIINNYIKVESRSDDQDYLGHILVDQAGLICKLNYDLDMTQIFNRPHVF